VRAAVDQSGGPSAPVRFAPLANAPTPDGRDTCSPRLAWRLALPPRLRVVVLLGRFGWTMPPLGIHAVSHPEVVERSSRSSASSGTPADSPESGYGDERGVVVQ
jgi:hypothetical protein